MRMRLSKLQDDDKEVKELSLKGLLEGWEDIKAVFYDQSLLYILKVICSNLINKYHNDPLADHFEIAKTQALITRKYYWLTL